MKKRTAPHSFIRSLIQWPILVSALLLVTACGGNKSLPMTVQSDPLGAYVTYQVRSSKNGSGDWIFLGKTPLDIKHAVSKKQFKKASAFRMRVMKEGYSEQIRDWTGNDLRDEIEEKGRLFWNPRLVPSK